MEVRYKGSRGLETFWIEKPEDFYPAVAEKMAAQEKGKKLQVLAGINDSCYVLYRISVRSGTQCISPLKDTMPAEFHNAVIKERYLGCIDRERNAYKYYRMKPGEGGTFTAEYGRCAVGAGQLFGTRSCQWKNEMYPVKLQEKLGKGYIDISEYILSDDTTNLSDMVIKKRKSTPSAVLFDILRGFAKEEVSRNVNVPVNEKLVAKSKELIGELREEAERHDMEAFNETLMFLMLIMQRTVRTGDGKGVENCLAHEEEDYARIVERETNLCEAMEGALTGKEIRTGDFSDFGVEVSYASEDEKAFIRRHLNHSLRDRVARVWKVSPETQEKRFNGYVERHGITEVRHLWHGSRNENWTSIIKNGLKLNPNAVITGKMFGKGIYFAPSAMKSFGYTSFTGSRWANGSSDSAFMGLYKTAYGKPYDVHSWSSYKDYEKRVKDGGYGCCHAHKEGGFLHDDEIVFYDESAMCLEYIVEFR